LGSFVVSQLLSTMPAFSTRRNALAIPFLTPLLRLIFLPLIKASPFLVNLSNEAGFKTFAEEGPEPVGSTEFWWKLGISAVFVLLGGAFAGLTLGLMGLDELHLRVLATSSDDPTERKNADKVLRLLTRGRHWVLVVLLLGNVIVNESLPIFLDSALGGGIAAVVISTIAIVIFGEIIPQAVSVRYGLSIGAKAAPFVLCLMWLFSPIAYPIALLLDYVLGKHTENTYKKAELKSFLQFHRTGEEPLRDDEISILNGVLELNTKSVEEIMTGMKDVVTLSTDTILDHKTVDFMLTSGYSRFPVHEPGNPLAFCGLLLVKKLLRYDPNQERPVSSFKLSILPEALPTINCFQALDYFQTGRAHLLLISKTPGEAGGAIGVITLEDIIEEIISEEIVDETDRYEDNMSKRKAKRMTTAAVMQGIVERERRATSNSERTPLLQSTAGAAQSEPALGATYGTAAGKGMDLPVTIAGGKAIYPNEAGLSESPTQM
jgi:metal transporter CNNM